MQHLQSKYGVQMHSSRGWWEDYCFLANAKHLVLPISTFSWYEGWDRVRSEEASVWRACRHRLDRRELGLSARMPHPQISFSTDLLIRRLTLLFDGCPCAGGRRC